MTKPLISVRDALTIMLFIFVYKMIEAAYKSYESYKYWAKMERVYS